MDVTIIIPVQAFETEPLAASLAGVFAQRYDLGRVEVFTVPFGGAEEFPLPSLVYERGARALTVDHPSPYAARNAAAARAAGDALLFTEPGCVPDPDWVGAHVATLRECIATVSVGHVAPCRTTRSVDLFLSYENARDAWVFSCQHWQNYFGRPKNMAITSRRFETHGPFVEAMRGADSKLVQRVVRDLSSHEVVLTPTAIVRQESVRGLPSCYWDRFRHARALRMHRSDHAAPIALGQRVRLFRETLEQRGYGTFRASELFLLLGAGIFSFRLGRWAGALTQALSSSGRG